MAATTFTLRPLGDTAWLLETPSSEINMAWYRACEAEPLAGVVDLLPAFHRLAVYFDPRQVSADTIADWVQSTGNHINLQLAPSVNEPATKEIPTLYDGADLLAIANNAGLSVSEAIKLHTSAEYQVGAIGFQPDFPYLEGLPAKLQMPRQMTPRTKVPRGAVGIGGAYTGIYPQASPGGWNLIGRTPIAMFDRNRQPASLLSMGDRVRFSSINQNEFDRRQKDSRIVGGLSEPDRALHPALRVISPGVQTTLQAAPLFGQQSKGITPGGAMDYRSHHLATQLSGHRADAESTTLESTLVGPVLECLKNVTIALAGALPEQFPRAKRYHLQAGDRIDLRKLTGGARGYLAVAGGLITTDSGQALAAGDILGTAEPPAPIDPNASTWSLASDLLPNIHGITTLRLIAGPQANAFDEKAWHRLLSQQFQVSPQSSRMGVRLTGPTIKLISNESMVSQPLVHGAIQVPPDGQPIVLGADRQTLGGYPVIACVASVDWPMLGQLRQGDVVRFAKIELTEAEQLRTEAERALAIAAVGIRSANHQ